LRVTDGNSTETEGATSTNNGGGLEGWQIGIIVIGAIVGLLVVVVLVAFFVSRSPAPETP